MNDRDKLACGPRGVLLWLLALRSQRVPQHVLAGSVGDMRLTSQGNIAARHHAKMEREARRCQRRRRTKSCATPLDTRSGENGLPQLKAYSQPSWSARPSSTTTRHSASIHSKPGPGQDGSSSAACLPSSVDHCLRSVGSSVEWWKPSADAFRDQDSLVNGRRWFSYTSNTRVRGLRPMTARVRHQKVCLRECAKTKPALRPYAETSGAVVGTDV